MAYRALTDLVVLAHLGFIAFVVLGGLLAIRWRWGPFLHVPAAAWGFFIELSGGVCPLTPLENSLRRAAGASGYSGGFLEHYLVPVIYPAGLSREVQLTLAATVVLANLLVYGIVWSYRVGLRRRRLRGKQQ